jgi:hypothetical protein
VAKVVEYFETLSSSSVSSIEKKKEKKRKKKTARAHRASSVWKLTATENSTQNGLKSWESTI